MLHMLTTVQEQQSLYSNIAYSHFPESPTITMTPNNQISDSEEEDSQVEIIKTPEKTPAKESPVPHSVLSIRNRDASQKPSGGTKGRDLAEDSIAVLVSGPERPWEYQPYNGDSTVDCVLEETKGPDGSPWYKIEYESGRKEKVSISHLCFGFVLFFSLYIYVIALPLLEMYYDIQWIVELLFRSWSRQSKYHLIMFKWLMNE